MKKTLTLFSVALFMNTCVTAQVKIGDNSSIVNANSLLELESTTKGLLLPRLTRTQIDAMTNVPKGMLVFNSTDSALYLRRDTGWAMLALGPGPADKWTTNGNNIYNTNLAGRVGIGTSSPFSQLSNTALNTIGSDSAGGNPGSLSWAARQEGYVGQFYNDGNNGNSNGLAVKVSVPNSIALDVSQGSQTVAGKPLLTVRSSGNVGLGTFTPKASAALEIVSADKGLLLPRYATNSISNIISPEKGLLIYDSTLAGFYSYNGKSWVAAGDNLGSHIATQSIKLNGNAISNNGANGVTIDNNGKVTLESAAIISGTGNSSDFLINSGSGTVGARKGYGGLGLRYIIATEGIFPPRSQIGGPPNYDGLILGEIRLFAGNFTPPAFLPCEGQLLLIRDHTALFSLLGVMYGGNGTTTFGLPDLRSAIPVGVGTATNGTSWSHGQTQ